MEWDKYLKGQKAPKTITVDKIKELSRLKGQIELKNTIDDLISRGYITPMGKDMTYLSPEVHIKYRVCNEIRPDLIHEMNFSYHISMNFDYYKKHIEDYSKDKNLIIKLSDYLKSGKLKATEPMSINERSFEIFGNEKFLASELGSKLLTRLKLQLNIFNVYRTPEPFIYYHNPFITADSKNVLIIENKDTWYTIRQLLREEAPIMGINFYAVIYGEGRKIQKSFKDIDYNEYQQINNPENTYYYFGDVDSYGIDILLKLQKDNSRYHIIPFTPAYRYLLQNKDRRRYKEEKEDKITLNIEEVNQVFSDLTSDDIEVLYDVCINNYILPQELVNNDVLRKGWNDETIS